MTRSLSNFIRIAVDIKSWVARTPTVIEARPGCCIRCGAASHADDGGLVLHGHGLRERQLRGPLEPGGAPVLLALLLRRYLCVLCGATMTVGPAGMLHRRLFSAAAIALALALWSVGSRPSPAVRAEISPLRVIGDTSARAWLTLCRWTADARRLFPVVRPWPERWPPRRAAERVACAVASLSPGTGNLPARAFFGAAQIR